MKNLVKVFIAMFAIASLGSCGGQKKVAESYLHNANPQQGMRVKRTQDPCELKALEKSENLRAVGTARSYDETHLRSNALDNAQTLLAQMIEVSIEGAIQTHAKDGMINGKISSSALKERIMTTYVAKTIKNTPIIESSMYDLSDGSIQMYVCVEMRTSEAELLDGIVDTLSDDEMLQLEYDRERFKKSVKSGLEEYKKKQQNQ